MVFYIFTRGLVMICSIVNQEQRLFQLFYVATYCSAVLVVIFFSVYDTAQSFRYYLNVTLY